MEEMCAEFCSLESSQRVSRDHTAFHPRSRPWRAFSICTKRPWRPTVLLHPLLPVFSCIKDQLQKPRRSATLSQHLPLPMWLLWFHLHHKEYLGNAQVQEAQHKATARTEYVNVYQYSWNRSWKNVVVISFSTIYCVICWLQL